MSAVRTDARACLEPVSTRRSSAASCRQDALAEDGRAAGGEQRRHLGSHAALGAAVGAFVLPRGVVHRAGVSDDVPGGRQPMEPLQSLAPRLVGQAQASPLGALGRPPATGPHAPPPPPP